MSAESGSVPSHVAPQVSGSVRTLSGTCCSLAELEQSVPEMHEIKLVPVQDESDGKQELKNDGKEPGEVQAVIVLSSAKAAKSFARGVECLSDTLTDFGRFYEVEQHMESFRPLDDDVGEGEDDDEHGRRRRRSRRSRRDMFHTTEEILQKLDGLREQIEARCEEAEAAAALLGSMQLHIPQDSCEKLLEVMHNLDATHKHFREATNVHDISLRIEVYKHWRHACINMDEAYDGYALIADDIRNRMGPLGAVFGRFCGDPKPYLKKLRTMCTCNMSPIYYRVHKIHWFSWAALKEIAMRCKPSMHSSAFEEIADLAAELLQESVEEDYMSEVADHLCRLLVHWGDASHKPLLQAVAWMKRKQQACRNDMEKVGQLTLDGVKLFSLRRMAKSLELRKHLSETPTLAHVRQRVLLAGCDLQPEWGNGALLFVPLTHEQVIEAELELCYKNIMILDSDFELLKKALAEFDMHGKRRPVMANVDLSASVDSLSVAVIEEDKNVKAHKKRKRRRTKRIEPNEEAKSGLEVDPTKKKRWADEIDSGSDTDDELLLKVVQAQSELEVKLAQDREGRCHSMTNTQQAASSSSDRAPTK